VARQKIFRGPQAEKPWLKDC